MANTIAPASIGQLFHDARSFNAWTDRPVPEQKLVELYELLKLAPTSQNGNPLRAVFVRTPQGRERLAQSMYGPNADKVRAAPVTAVLAYDSRFYDHLPFLFPHAPQRAQMYIDSPALAEETAFRNASMQAGYFILAARAVGLDCGPMSGFRHDGVERDFFPDGRFKVNLVCAIGHGDRSQQLWERLPRFAFEQVCSFA